MLLYDSANYGEYAVLTRKYKVNASKDVTKYFNSFADAYVRSVNKVTVDIYTGMSAIAQMESDLTSRSLIECRMEVFSDGRAKSKWSSASKEAWLKLFGENSGTGRKSKPENIVTYNSKQLKTMDVYTALVQSFKANDMEINTSILAQIAQYIVPTFKSKKGEELAQFKCSLPMYSRETAQLPIIFNKNSIFFKNKKYYISLPSGKSSPVDTEIDINVKKNKSSDYLQTLTRITNDEIPIGTGLLYMQRDDLYIQLPVYFPPTYKENKTLSELAKSFTTVADFEAFMDQKHVDIGTVMGIDLGLTNPYCCVMYDGKPLTKIPSATYVGKEKEFFSMLAKHNNLKRRMASARKSNKITIGRDVAVMKKNFHHQSSCRILRKALSRDVRVIAMEDLEGADPSSQFAKFLRHAAPAQFESLMQYKADKEHINVFKINPAYTSCTCPLCGNSKPSLRIDRNTFVCDNPLCSINGQKYEADRIGATNIAVKGYNSAVKYLTTCLKARKEKEEVL